MRWFLAPLLASAMALSLPAHAGALDWPDLSTPPEGLGGGENDAALIIGVENYTYIADVPGAAQNALDWYRFLTARGVPSHKIRLLVDPFRDATGALPTDDPKGTNDGILAAASQAAADVGEGGTLWFVFIGHGAPARSGDDGLLVGVDASGTAVGIYNRSVSRTKILSTLAEGQQAHTVAVLDTCFSGRSPAGAPLVADLQPVIPIGLSVTTAATVLTATSANQFAGPLPGGGGRPAFSYLVLGALEGWGDDNEDGDVTAREAVDYSRNALMALVTDRQQEPQLEGGEGGLVLGVGGVGGAPDIDAMRIALVTGGSTSHMGPTTGPSNVLNVDMPDVARMLAEQQCERAGYDAAESQQRDALADAQVTETTELQEQWAVLAEQAETCAQLNDDTTRARCHAQVSDFADRLEGREITVAPRLIAVETDCGERQVAANGLNEPSAAALSALVGAQALLARYDDDDRLTDDDTGSEPATGDLRVDGRATYTESLRAGFRGDPRTYSVNVGDGTGDPLRTSALDLGPGCLGYVDPSGPAMRLTYRAGRSPLRIAACDGDDTTLLVHGPTGWVCDDDGGPGTNPEVLLESPESGTYDIFVGTINPSLRSAVDLNISELTAPTFCEVAHDAPASLDAMDYRANARYGTLRLSAGFSNDPREQAAQAGGSAGSSVEARDLRLGDGCRGVVDPSRPDFSLDYTSGTYPLRMAFCSPEDTSLLARSPSGEWYCDDDNGSGLNPLVSVDDPDSGQWDVWLGSVNGVNHPGNLYVTERASLDPCSTRGRPASPTTASGRPNVGGEPRYGVATLRSGFQPDPSRAAVQAGGNTDVRTQNLDPSCRGYIATGRPDYRVQYTAGRYSLRVASCSDTDTTLVINDAAGNWFCSDDVEGHNPVVTWNSPPSGQYDVWVGTYSSGEAQSEVVVSEGSGPYCN